VAIVTDSAAGLSANLLRAHRVLTVPLRVLAGGLSADDDGTPLPAAMQDAVRAGERLTTARPGPELFAIAYRQAADAGARSVVSIHLSRQLSGTVSVAELAARSAPVPVWVVDSWSIGMGLGLVVLAAARAASAGLGTEDVVAVAVRRAAATGSFFALDSAEALLAGGRLVTADLVPAVLVSRPLLEIRAGRITALERVRTRSAATDRLTDLAAKFAVGRDVDIAVQHTGCGDRAAELTERLARVIPRARQVYLAEAGPVIRMHTGPGMLGVALAPC
jgi:DegV family protein with EDD domain